MTKRFIIYTFSIFIFTSFYYSSYAKEALTFMQDVIYQFEQLRGDLVDDFSKNNRAKVSQNAKKLALSILDINEISRLALGKYAKKMKTKDREEFTKLFHELMAGRVVAAQIPDKKILSKKIPIKIKKELTKLDKVFKKEAIIVYTDVPHKRVVYNVDFYLFKKNGKLKLYDIHLDQSSTLLDFRNQFARIIKKKGIRYLTEKLRKKIKQLKKEKK